MNSALELAVTQSQAREGTRRTLRLHRSGTDAGADRHFQFDLLGERDAPAPELLDGFVLAVLFLAMAEGNAVRVHGALTRSALYNFDEIQRAWACWCPTRYRPVEIKPDRIVDVLPAHWQDPRAIALFSGGVDGTFTALRHRHRLAGATSYPLSDVLLVHGFDVPLARPDAFERLLQRIRPTLDELGLRVRLLRTDLKELSGQYWEYSFGAQLAACLHNYSHEFRYGLMGSSEPYDHMVFPWGSNAVTDPLMSGDGLRLVVDGTAFSRTEKVEVVNRYPTATRTLKVCWEGPDPERNCGHCEKCIRTKLNFMAVGNERPDCFDEPLAVAAIGGIQLRFPAQVTELDTIVQYAQRHGREGPWLAKLQAKLTAYRNRQAPPGMLALAKRRLKHMLRVG